MQRDKELSITEAGIINCWAHPFDSPVEIYPNMRANLNKLVLYTFLASFPSLIAGQCSSPQPIHLCCRSLAPYSSNSYVWEHICGYSGVTDPTVPVVGGCANLVPWSVYPNHHVHAVAECTSTATSLVFTTFVVNP